jgi:hypothetical protein
LQLLLTTNGVGLIKGKVSKIQINSQEDEILRLQVYITRGEPQTGESSIAIPY